MASTTLLSSRSTSVSEDVDLELVQEIIERAPRTATTFPQVFEAYGQVLQSHGISQAGDTAYYNFLLKLGVIRAPTWGERWDLWCATHMSTLSTPKRVVAEGVRARVPFLASASSNLDEGYGDDESVVLRPSPRKVMAHRSLEYDLLTFDPPPRTSTPVYAQESGYRSPPPLPPYSVSDVSYLDDYKVRGIGEGEESTESQPQVYGSAEEIRELEAEVQRGMEASADAFFDTGLLGRCFDVWARASDWVQTTTRQIDAVRDGILLRQTLLKWRHQHERHLALPATADAHRRMHLQSQALKLWIKKLGYRKLRAREGELAASLDARRVAGAWTRWRVRAVERRTERWKRDMREREAVFVSEKREQLMGGVVEFWRHRTRVQLMQKLADGLRRRKDLQTTFDTWLYRACQQRNIAEAMTTIHTGILSAAFDVWRRRAKLVPIEARLVDERDAGLLKRVWSDWKLQHSRRKSATAFADTHSIRAALKRWRRAMQDVRTIEGRAALVNRRRDVAAVRDCFTIWRTKARGLVLRQALDVRLERKTLERWTARMGHVRGMLERASGHSIERQGRSVQVTFRRWRDRHSSLMDQAIRADLRFDTHLVAAAVLKWKATTIRLKEDAIKADKAAAFFALRQAWRVWNLSLAVKKQNAWVERKRVEETREVFAVWRDAALRSQQDRQAVETFRTNSGLNLVRDALARWTERVVEIKSRELDVVERRDAALIEHAMSRWIASHERVAGLHSLLESHLVVKAEDHLRAVLRGWRDIARLRKARRLEAERMQAERERKLLEEAFSTWRGTVRERQLASMAEEVEAKHEDALLFAVWDRWKAKSTMLPVISFERRRLLRLAMHRWTRAMALVKAEHEAQAPKNRRLLEEAMDIWKDAYAARAAKRSRRTRFRPSLGTSIRQRGDVSEPAYSRLRSELSEPGSALFKALRGTLPER